MNHPTVRCLRICKLRFVKTESFIITSHIFVLYVICLHIRWRWAHVLRVSFTCSLGILVNLCRYFSISFHLILKSVMGFAYHNKFFFHVCPFIFVHVSSFQLFFNFDVNCFQWFYPDFHWISLVFIRAIHVRLFGVDFQNAGSLIHSFLPTRSPQF